MNRYYDEKEIKNYIIKYELEKIVPDIGTFDESRLSVIKARKGEQPLANMDDNDLVFLLEGAVKNCAMAGNGKKILLHIAEGFEMLRDLEIFRIKNIEMYIETLRNSVLLVVNLKGIREKLMNDPRFLRPVVNQIGMKLRNTTIAQTMIATYNLENRLSSYIMHTSSRKFDGNLVFNESLVETADLLGTSYRHLLRVLKGFCDDDILEKRNGEYWVIDSDKLIEIASDSPIYGKFAK